jgi:Phospholipid methyltransferase
MLVLRQRRKHDCNRSVAAIERAKWAGVVLCVLGFGLGLCAPWYLGRNWGMPMSCKEQPELVTSGPYAFIRHPIYTGPILAMLGSAIGVGGAAGPDRRVLHLKCSKRRIRHAAAIPGAVHDLHRTIRDARAAAIPALKRPAGVRPQPVVGTPEMVAYQTLVPCDILPRGAPIVERPRLWIPGRGN